MAKISKFTSEQIKDIESLLREQPNAILSTNPEHTLIAIQLNEIVLRVGINHKSDDHPYLFSIVAPGVKAAKQNIGSIIYTDTNTTTAQVDLQGGADAKTVRTEKYPAIETAYYTNPIVMGTITRIMYNICHLLYIWEGGEQAHKIDYDKVKHDIQAQMDASAEALPKEQLKVKK